jgi:hypothetical protein
MSTIIRRKRSSRLSIGPYKRHELLTGEMQHYLSVGYTGYGDGKSTRAADYISDEMRADWEQNREELLAFWNSGEPTTSETFPDSKPWLFAYGTPGTVPWAAKQFDRVVKLTTPKE